MSDKKYVLAIVTDYKEHNGEIFASVDGHPIWVRKESLRTEEELCSEAAKEISFKAAEEYREAVKLFSEVSSFTAKEIFGLKSASYSEFLSLPVEEVIEKARVYEEEIKPGQLWYGQLGQYVVVKEAGEKAVKCFYADKITEKIAVHSILVEEFKRDYRKAHDMSEGYEIFDEELREKQCKPEGDKENG